MRATSSILLTLICLSSRASETHPYWVRFGEEKTMLERYDKDFINKSCQGCLAKSHLKQKVKLSQSEVNLKNPSSLACAQVKGIIRIGKLFNGHSQSFCFFKDGSLMSANSFVITVE